MANLRIESEANDEEQLLLAIAPLRTSPVSANRVIKCDKSHKTRTNGNA